MKSNEKKITGEVKGPGKMACILNFMKEDAEGPKYKLQMVVYQQFRERKRRAKLSEVARNFEICKMRLTFIQWVNTTC